MWSTLLLPLLLLQLIQLHATVAMATASGGLTVIDGASTSTSSSSTTTSSTTTISSRHSSSSSSSTSNAVSPLNQRKRHRKRNSNWYDYRNYSENNTAVEWMNPCGGSYYTPSATESRRAQRPKQIFNQLKRAAGTEYRELNSTQDHKGIDIGDMQVWSLHKYNYKFLPKLKPNSTIALKRWYRNMQTYVASFAYLRRVQINWDRQNLKRESAIAKELKRLLLSSRSMLCELETAVNRTYPMPPTLGVSGKQRRQLQLPQISRNDMNRRLKLRSKMRPAAAAAATTTEAATVAATAIGEADPMDMRFVKHHYYEFLRTMWQLLRRDSKRERQQRRQKRQRRQQRQREQLHHQQQSPLIHRQEQEQQQKPQQQQQQRQRQRQWQQQHQRQQVGQQQRLQQSLDGAGNRNEFNEVSKPLPLDVAGAAGGRRGKRQQPLSAAAAANQRQLRRVLRT